METATASTLNRPGLWPVGLTRRWVLGGMAALASNPSAAEAPSRDFHPSLASYERWVLASSTGSPPSQGLRARFFGITTLLFECAQHQLLVDGYFSRPGPFRSFVTGASPHKGRIAEGLRLLEIHELDGILVAHGHHDHAMDSADVAKKTGGLIMGPPATIALARERGFTGKVVELQDRGTYCVGGFRVEAIPSPHVSPNLFPRPPARPLPRRAQIWRYGDDRNFSYVIGRNDTSVLVQPSADLPKDGLQYVSADVVFLSVGSLAERDFDRYWAEAVTETGAALVVPVHFDNFFRTLDNGTRPLPWPLDNVRRSLDLVLERGDRAGVPVGFMPLFRAVDLLAGGEVRYADGRTVSVRTLHRKMQK